VSAPAHPAEPAARRWRALPPPWLALGALCALAALLRLPTLGAQSLWFDEAVTAVDVLKPTLFGTLAAVPDQELAPPLYPVLVWTWSQLFGTGEAGLRSFSALASVLTVPLAYAAAARLGGRRAGLVAGALVALNPLLVWYGQEARHYALLVLLGALTLLLFLRALERGTSRALLAWAAAASLALLTHYFAAFLLLPQAVWLLVRAGRRALPALAIVGGVGLALLPLALHQRGTGGADWVALIPWEQRVADFGQTGWLAGWPEATHPLWLVPAGLFALVLGVLLARADRAERRGALTAAGVGLGALALAAALALAGADYLYFRHHMAALAPLLVAAAVLLASRRAGRLGAAAVAGICALWLLTNLAVAARPEMQRDDWRAAARALGPARAPRVVVVNPFFAREPLVFYGHRLAALPPEGAVVSEVALVGTTTSGTPLAARPDLPGFRLVGEPRRVQRVRVSRLVAPAPTRVGTAALAAALDVRPDAVALELPR
jgi:4-amino-4-deoxy-L-arabinose transferase-like glycosyltransferase